MIFDSNLAGFDKAKTLIAESLESGWLADVRCVHRPYALAVRSMIERAMETGRYIPLGPPSKLAKLRRGAQRTIARFRLTFSEEFVGIYALANLWTPLNPVDATPIPLAEPDIGGTCHYKHVEELHAIEAEIIASLREDHTS